MPRALPSVEGWRTIAALAAGFTVSALLVYGALRAVFTPGWPSDSALGARRTVLAACAIGAIAVDLYSLIGRRLSPLGLSRQTPKGLLYGPRLRQDVGAFLWGLDTGTSVSTFRVSAATWVVLAATILGLTPWWIGACYAAGFVIPVVVLLSLPMRRISIAAIGRLLHQLLWLPQVVCLALLATATFAMKVQW